jgi:hypothetical protein
MTVCLIGRETIEYDEHLGEWVPTVHPGPVPVHASGACRPAIQLTIELIVADHEPAPCAWCSWPTHDGALYLINGKGCCEVHVERAVREETVILAARDATRILAVG